MRDMLRANVFRPPGGERYPVVLSIHPYGKDNLPTRRGKRWTYSFQYHVLRQPEPASLDRGNPPDRRSLRRPLAGTMALIALADYPSKQSGQPLTKHIIVAVTPAATAPTLTPLPGPVAGPFAPRTTGSN
jgi:hypothetical protein